MGVPLPQSRLVNSTLKDCIDMSAKTHLAAGEKLAMEEMASTAAAETFRYYNR